MINRLNNFFILLCIVLCTILCACTQTRGFLAEDDFEMRDPTVQGKRYTEGFLDITIKKKGSTFPSYTVLSCEYTKQNLSSMVMTRSSGIGAEDTVKVLNRDEQEIGTYMVFFHEDDQSSLISTVTATARLVIPYTPQTAYLQFGRKKLELKY